MDKCFGQKSENQLFQYASIDNQSDYESLSSPSTKNSVWLFHLLDKNFKEIASEHI